ncbi:MAG: serine/threonine-protein kinase, partial [candidate division Zixibacteria bacterium]
MSGRFSATIAGLSGYDRTIALSIELCYIQNLMEREYLGDYKLIRELGRGGMGAVFLAHPKDLPEHQVVLKELLDPRHFQRFKGEAKTLVNLKHDKISRLLHFFTHGHSIVIAMEYVEGRTLKEYLEQVGTLPVNEALSITMDLLETLEYAHQHRVFHRDIKPGNLMIDNNGSIMVIDFGIAKDSDNPDITQEGVGIGTAAYAPPEQLFYARDIDWAVADIYSVGTTLYMLITGRLPFEGERTSDIVQAKRLSDPPMPSDFNPEISSRLDNVILKSIARQPEDRYSSASEMLEQIEILAADYPPVEKPAA